VRKGQGEILAYTVSGSEMQDKRVICRGQAGHGKEMVFKEGREVGEVLEYLRQSEILA
jgi:hypothetical protein